MNLVRIADSRRLSQKVIQWIAQVNCIIVENLLMIQNRV